MMADVATWFRSPEWINYGLTPTYVSATQYTLAANQTTIHSVGRRVRATVTAGTIYGTITASVFGSLTTVTVAWDSGSLDSGLSEVDVGLMNPLNPSFPTGMNLAANSLNVTNSAQTSVTVTTSGGSCYERFVTNSGSKYIGAIGNTFAVVNNANSAVLLQIDDSGNLTSAGNITSNSDERLKYDWEGLPLDFIERLSLVKSGTYTRIDTEARQAGVGAQSLQSLLPEAVIESEKGFLSVAYGQAALVACVELAKEVVRLRALLEQEK
jgi:hypothetical protein